MDKIYDAAIIGGGPAGYTAALYCARAGLETLVVEKLSAGGQMANIAIVENYPGFPDGVDGFEFGEKMKAGAERFGAETLFAEAEELRPEERPKLVRTTEGDVRARTVIIATGALPRKIGFEGEEEFTGRGVAYCAACDGMRYRGGTVAVAGGGNSAVTDALTLSKICKKVYLVHRRDSLRADKVYSDHLREAGNIEIVWNARIDGLEHGDTVTGLRVTDRISGVQSVIACDCVFVAVGRVPDTAIAKDRLALDEQGYIIADETTRTSVGGVFAVGDVRTKPLRQIVTAAADGAVSSIYALEYIIKEKEYAK